MYQGTKVFLCVLLVFACSTPTSANLFNDVQRVVSQGVNALRGVTQGHAPPSDVPPKIPASYTAKGRTSDNLDEIFTSNGLLSSISISVQPIGEFIRTIEDTTNKKTYGYMKQPQPTCEARSTPERIVGKGLGWPHVINHCGEEGFECVKKDEKTWRLTVHDVFPGENVVVEFEFDSDRLVSMATMEGEEPSGKVMFDSMEPSADESLLVIPSECEGKESAGRNTLLGWAHWTMARVVVPTLIV